MGVGITLISGRPTVSWSNLPFLEGILRLLKNDPMAFLLSPVSVWGRPTLGPTALKFFEFQQRPASHCPDVKQHPAK
jgi:hypothetical protein